MTTSFVAAVVDSPADKRDRGEQAVRIVSELQNIIHSAGVSVVALLQSLSLAVVAVKAAAPIIAVDRNNRITEPVCPEMYGEATPPLRTSVSALHEVE